MKYGFIVFPTPNVIPPGDLGEDRGFESLIVPDHTHILVVTPNATTC